ncbi:uncharacterized protein NPIL_259951 [Nephila pilipes]|uniref:Uncharacterized protein n=1 Tax=Nephila pilipes TaxID=299642 RepID=A0A8X6JX36_NEPPI|nr:uncharacterized protein NPIL_259951 [Nephila pilipes]
MESLSGPEQPSEISQLLASVNGVSNEVFEPEESLVSTETKEPFVVKDSSNYINIHQTSQKAEQLAIQKEKSNSKNEISLKTNEIRSKSLDSNHFFVPTKAMHLAQEIPSHIINVQTVKERSHLSDELSKSTFGIQQNIPSHPNIEIKRKMILSSSETEESMISHSYPKINKKKCKHASLLKKEESIPLLLEEQSCSKHYESLDEENTRDQTPNFDLNEKFQNPTSLPPPSTPPLPKTSLFEPFRVFSDVTFLLILVTQSLLQYNCTLFLTIIVDLSRDDGLSSSQEIIVLVCMSIADLLGRIGLGWFTDLGFISNIYFSAICCFTMSTAFGGLVFVKEFKLVCCLVFVFGLSLGGMLIVSPGVIYDYIEEDKRPMALAARFFLYALLSATQSPLIGKYMKKNVNKH